MIRWKPCILQNMKNKNLPSHACTVAIHHSPIHLSYNPGLVLFVRRLLGWVNLGFQSTRMFRCLLEEHTSHRTTDKIVVRIQFLISLHSLFSAARRRVYKVGVNFATSDVRPQSRIVDVFSVIKRTFWKTEFLYFLSVTGKNDRRQRWPVTVRPGCQASPSRLANQYGGRELAVTWLQSINTWLPVQAQFNDKMLYIPCV